MIATTIGFCEIVLRLKLALYAIYDQLVDGIIQVFDGVLKVGIDGAVGRLYTSSIEGDEVKTCEPYEDLVLNLCTGNFRDIVPTEYRYRQHPFILTVHCTRISCTRHGIVCDASHNKDKVQLINQVVVGVLHLYKRILAFIVLGEITEKSVQTQTVLSERPLFYNITFTIIDFERRSTGKNAVLIYIHILYVGKS
ncbi:MAG: hypothetical protein IKW20_08330 [Bacteroidales bacterium]|nr:hypothetical protein [Bacteroidales bacterium]